MNLKNAIMSFLCALVFGSVALAQKTDDALQTKLNEKKEQFNASASEAKKQTYADGFKAVKATGILDQALNVGDEAPDFTLKNQLGKTVSLKNELENGPVILIWYRGGWCPYCNITLHYMQERLPDFKAEGANLLALTPELPDNSITTSEKHELEFNVLSDQGNKVARQYGVVFKLTDEVAEIYQNSFDLHAVNGDESNELPMAVTYVIDTDGIIKYAFLDVDYRNRAEPDEIIAALREL